MKENSWRIRPYRKANATCPVQEFLDTLNKSAHDHFRKVVAQVWKVAKQPSSRRYPLIDDVDDMLWKVRIVDAGPGYRVYYHVRGDIMVVLLAIKKKRKKATSGDETTAHNYLADYYERCLDDEDEYEEEWYV